MEKNKNCYPVLKRIKDYEFVVVLFTKENTGVVVYSSNKSDNCFKLGTYREDWNEKDFIIYDQLITLSNQ